MIVSELNYLEEVSEANQVTGAADASSSTYVLAGGLLASVMTGTTAEANESFDLWYGYYSSSARTSGYVSGLALYGSVIGSSSSMAYA
ncbi:hypothetical protein [Oxynema aestuarii]|jgi:hypothetical protein|uniref:Uncharacterized protein n=1 Tax=Oxynema aestuarii AP17 TaxID=2064643 RepID=A0A6H1U3C4_9CYAN|nr:hypothetical protein [Oxynema aestuarii]QIZ72660.1 hypothetical protein HCG48_20395 [Oxynema aestuarii AP17]